MKRDNAQATPDVDVIIVGGGITGLVLAGLLARDRQRVAIIEARVTGDEETLPPDPRALAITLASCRILNTIGAWPCLPSDRIGEFRRMQVWDENGEGRIEFDAAGLGHPALGYIIESNVLLQALLDALKNSMEINWYRPARATALETPGDLAVLALDDGRRISARLIVAADGKQSQLRTLAGIGFTRESYDQEALACIVKTERPHGYIARQRFLTNGTLAFLPLHDPHACGIVWSTRPEETRQLVQSDEPRFHRTLQSAIENELGAITASGPRIAYPLGYGYAESYIGDRLALIGDAAHVVHPLAGQGANLGILDAAALAQTLAEARDKGRDPGDHAELRRYERWRKGENRLMMHIMTGFKELFTHQEFPVPVLRNLGLDITDKLIPVKHRIMEYAMGIRGDLPEVARRPV